MLRADYGQIAHTYDLARPLVDTRLGFWLDLFASAGRLRPGRWVLDLGCGTGRFSLPIARHLGCRVMGLDRSPEMLAQAGTKDPSREVAWVRGDASRLPCRDGSFDAALLSHLLHHVDEPAAVLRECRRVLVPGGVALVRYGAMAQIRDDPEHVFFPETVAVDEARTPEVGDVEEWLGAAGFARPCSQAVRERDFASGEQRLEAARLRHTSVLTLIPEQAYSHGLARMEAYVAEHPGDDWLLHDTMTLTSAVAGA